LFALEPFPYLFAEGFERGFELFYFIFECSDFLDEFFVREVFVVLWRVFDEVFLSFVGELGLFGVFEDSFLPVNGSFDHSFRFVHLD